MNTHSINLLTIINLVSNIVIGSSIFMFIISVFGRSNHPIWNNKYEAYVAKIGLGISGCGALMNALTFSTPVASEIILNVGMALNFCWLSLWQYRQMKEDKQKPKPRLSPKKKPNTIANKRSKIK